MSKIPTAEEFCKEKAMTPYEFLCDNLKEFAKLHVEAALKAASENIPGFGSSTDIPDWEEVEKEVLNAYPLENIK